MFMASIALVVAGYFLYHNRTKVSHCLMFSCNYWLQKAVGPHGLTFQSLWNPVPQRILKMKKFNCMKTWFQNAFTSFCNLKKPNGREPQKTCFDSLPKVCNFCPRPGCLLKETCQCQYYYYWFDISCVPVL